MKEEGHRLGRMDVSAPPIFLDMQEYREYKDVCVVLCRRSQDKVEEVCYGDRKTL